MWRSLHVARGAGRSFVLHWCFQKVRVRRKLEIVQPCDFDATTAPPSATAGAVHCRGCGHDVFDLTRMTRAEAIAFLDHRQPNHCVFFENDEDDRIVFADGVGDVIGRVARDARPMIAVAALLAACGSGDPQEKTQLTADRAPAAAEASQPSATAETSAPVAFVQMSSSAEAPCEAAGSATPVASASSSSPARVGAGPRARRRVTTGVAPDVYRRCTCNPSDPLCGCD
jgi:hypothetical protein